MSENVICTLQLCILDVVACQLSVQPNGSVFHRSLGDNIVFTCSLDMPGGSVIVNIQWLNEDQVEILDKSPGRDKYDEMFFCGSKSALEILLAKVEFCLYGSGLSGCMPCCVVL